MVTAAHTQKALDDERPAAYGTTESIKIFIPFGVPKSLSFESIASTDLYPHRK